MSLEDLQQISCVTAAEPEPPRPMQGASRRVLYISERRRSTEKMIEELLSSAMVASDVELRRILLELDNIAKILKSEGPDGAQALKIARHPAVWSVMKQALLNRELRHLALTDDLTCLYNRRGFFAAATQLLKLAQRKNQSLLLFYGDMDKLKHINDSWGHHEGDLALVRVADALEHTFRDSDVIARIGGDEFAVLGMEASFQSQGAIVQRLKRNLKKCNSAETRYPLSMSLGIARFEPKRPVSLGELLIAADQAMYEQKRQRGKSIPDRPGIEGSPSNLPKVVLSK